VGIIANLLLIARGAPLVSTRWLYRFITRYEKLKTRQVQRYDYRRALYEDLAAINAWFSLIENIIAKYGIADDDIYNFDETGFQIGVILAGIVVISSERVLNAKLMQPGNREWATVIQGVGGKGFCFPPFIIIASQYHLSSWYKDSPLLPD
jgi:hypothetical protein